MLSKFSGARARNRLLRAKADEARDARSWPLAAALYEIYLSQPPQDRDAPIWVQLGHARKESGDDSQAMTAYLRSLEIAPDVADTHLQIGHLHKKNGRLDQAAASYATAASYAKAAQLGPGLRQADQELAHLAVTPAEAEPWLLRADGARDGGRWSEAAAFYARHLEAKPDDESTWPLWVQLGHARKEAGDNDGAVEAYERAIELKPDDAEIHLHLGHLNKRMGDVHAAVASFARALSLDPDIGDAAEELRALRRQVSTDAGEPIAASSARTMVDRGIRYALPLPHAPEQVMFEPESPDIFVGLSRRFTVKKADDAVAC